MAKHSADLFKNRSATKEFLFSRSDNIIDSGESEQELTDRDDAETSSIKTCFSDMLDRKGLMDVIDSRMASVSSLFAMAVGFEWSTKMKPNEFRKSDISQNSVTPIATVFRDNNGTWARIGRNRLACVFPNLTDADGQVLARQLLSALPDEVSRQITIGTAAFPTIDFPRNQIVNNAEMALEHAGFFGPATVTGFDAVSLNISGDRHYQAGDITAAIDSFKKGLLLDPRDVNLHNSLGVCHGVLKDYENALTAFENALRLTPEGMMAIYNKGYILLLKGKREQALKLFLEADALEPDVFEVVFHIGQTFVGLGSPEKARPYLEAATRISSRSGPALKSLGACLAQLGLTKEAIQAYKGVVKVNPDDAESLSVLGRLYAKRGESLDVASALCKQSIRLSPDDGIFRHRLGCVYPNQGKFDLALEQFELAVSLGHDSRPKIEETQSRMTAAKAS